MHPEFGTFVHKHLKGIFSRWSLRLAHFFSSGRKERWRRKADIEMANLRSMPKHQRFPGLMKLGLAAIRQDDHQLQKDVIRAIGELGTDDSVPFIEDWLANKSLDVTWQDLLKGISLGIEEAEPQWKDRVFRALENGLDDLSNTYFFAAWPFVSWPAAMVAIDPVRSIRAFVERGVLIPGVPGFAAVVTAINASSEATVPAEVAAIWLPTSRPSLNDRIAVEQYLLQLEAHAEHDLPETKRRLWELVDGGSNFSQQSAALLLRTERLPDPVWTLDTRVQRVGLDKVRPAERIVWIVANRFTFPINTSGFDRFAVSYEANHLPETIDALTEIGATQTARCLREWSLLFGNEWPVDEYKRGEMVNEQSIKSAEAWTSVLERSNCTENVELLNLRYQLRHADQFELNVSDS